MNQKRAGIKEKPYSGMIPNWTTASTAFLRGVRK
jgi:hypothetical protein